MESATFLLVAQFLNQLRHRFSPNMYVPGSLLVTTVHCFFVFTIQRTAVTLVALP
jgi:hypothetical protein